MKTAVEQAELFEVDPTMRGVLAPGKRRAYVLAGRSIVTIRNPKSGTRFTYRIRAWKKPASKVKWYFVKVLTGQNNETDYQDLGTIYPYGFKTHSRAKISETAPSFVAFKWFTQNYEHAALEVWHEGSCGRCGRKLTVPESIATGLGPVCEGLV